MMEKIVFLKINAVLFIENDVDFKIPDPPKSSVDPAGIKSNSQFKFFW
jgi:hypothetical protein